MIAVPRPILAAGLARRKALATATRMARAAHRDHAAACETCAALWPPCEAAGRLIAAWREAIEDEERAGW